MNKWIWSAIFVALYVCPLTEAKTRLINGDPVPSGLFQEVVSISSGTASCTATIVGPRAIITAAHCAKAGATASFSYKGTNYQATMTRSPIYPGEDHDIALGVLSQDIAGAEPFSIGGKPSQGLEITLLGYGCTQPGGGGGNDGVLRWGKNTITKFANYDMISKRPGGAALCFGDSGGPAFVKDGDDYLLIGINSKGNIIDTNYNTRLDIPETDTFLNKFVSDHSIQICGVNKNCNTQEPPTCTLSANPSTVEVGKTVMLTINTQGNATSAEIEGQIVNPPTGSISITADTVGTHNVSGKVTGPGGSSSCQASYTATSVDPPPTCTLSANPQSFNIGGSTTVSIQTSGLVDSASIDGKTVGFPIGSIAVTPASVGTHSSTGTVNGPGGSNQCSVSYNVKDGPPAPTCVITANPSWIQLGQSLKFTLRTYGNSTNAKVNGQNVSLPVGTLEFTPPFSGFHSAIGTVTGAGGTTQCQTNYRVDGDNPDPGTDFTVIPAYCGDNVISEIESTVKEVCMAVVSHSYENNSLSVKNVLLIRHADLKMELLPIILKKQEALTKSRNIVEKLTLYTNGLKWGDDGEIVMKTTEATLTSTPSSQAKPLKLKGKSQTGQPFDVTEFNPVGN